MTARERAVTRARKGAESAKRRRDPLVKVEHQRTVVAMWTQGCSSQEIADALRVSTETVRRIRRQALAEAIVDRDVLVADARETELRRLDALQAAYWTRARGIPMDVFDEHGEKLPLDLRVANEDAARIVLKCVTERAKLLGLYAPIKVDAQVRSELDAQIEQLVEELESKGLAKVSP